MPFRYTIASSRSATTKIAVLSFLICSSLFSTADAIDPPRMLDANWKIELIAAEPELVTPTGCCFDDQGRLLVIECHTHFPPEDYDGPKTDRIYRFDDSDGDGVLDRKHLFHEGGVATMNIANVGGGWFAVATRSELIRIRDSNDDGVADQREVLLTHKTKAVYPHNGLGGLTAGPDGWLYVGQGENFGEPYKLIGTDGSEQIGGGEGGNVYRCKTDGSQLERIATGFWNPFGMCVDSAERLWVVGNDPDAMPPNRLLHVVPGGDYGFQFRFGRAGTHPLLAWNGELPGTLPMVTGTGEAACAVAVHGQHLWVTSWGDNRIERYKITPRGASWSSDTDVVVQGDANFRPVGMSVAKDGSIYVTDWVDRSYPVHGKGRLWRLSRVEPIQDSGVRMPGLTKAEKRASALRSSSKVTNYERLAALGDDDPFVRQAAVSGLVQSEQLSTVSRERATAPRQRVGLIAGWRWGELTDVLSVTIDQRRQWIEWGLADGSEEVVLISLRWAAERDCTEQLPAIRALLDRDNLSARLFSSVIASIAYLETGSAARGKRDPAIEKLLVEFARDANHAAQLRALAVQRIPADATSPSDEQLGQWITAHRDRPLALEVVRLLVSRATESATAQLAAIAADEKFDVQTRADALAGLSKNAGRYSAVINQMSLPRRPEVLRSEARRVRNRTWKSSGQTRPHQEDIKGWDALVGSGGNVDSGRRVFFRTTCANCHMHSGRGADTGPDLTTLSGTMSSARLLESILLPSKEIGPLYVPWRVLTVDGKVLTGLKLNGAGVGTNLKFQGADGNRFEVALADIEVQQPVAQSIMPTGLQDDLTLDELRDLIAFLTGPGISETSRSETSRSETSRSETSRSETDSQTEKAP